MTELIQIIFLAVVQAFTEFLPISSSGHLVIMEKILGFEGAQLELNIMLHMGTLMSVIVYFHRDLLNILFDSLSAFGELFDGNRVKDIMYRNQNLKLFIYALIAVIPAGCVGVYFSDQIEQSFNSLLVVGLSLIFTGGVILLTRVSPYNEKSLNDLSMKDAFIVGLAQAISILPGVSRSGMTIATGLKLGLSRDLAFRFSFILSIPTILGAFVFKLKDISQFATDKIFLYIIGALVAFVVGLVAIKILSRIVIRGNFYLFSYYCFFVGFITLIISFF